MLSKEMIKLKSDSPKVSVVMTVYNGEKVLAETIESILGQTFQDFEFIVIDDGSNDGTPRILASYQQSDGRINVYSQENQGVVAARNMGCRLARGEYIAFVDADDPSLPERLVKQVSYMDEHPEIGVLGTWVELIDEKSVPYGVLRTPILPAVLKWSLIFEDYFSQSSVMMRRDIGTLLGFFRPDVLLAEDYDLYSRASYITQLAILPEVLVRNRAWEGRLSAKVDSTIEKYAYGVVRSAVTKLLGTEVSLDAARMLRNRTKGLNLDQIEQTIRLLLRLYHAYLNANSLTRVEAKEIAHLTGNKLYGLAVQAGKRSLLKFLAIYIQAVKLNPGLIFTLPKDITNGVVRVISLLFGHRR